MTDFEVKTPYGVVEVKDVAQVLHIEGNDLAFLDAEDRTVAGFLAGSWAFYRRIEAKEVAEPVAIVVNEGDTLTFEQFAKTPVGTKGRDADRDIWTNTQDGPRWTNYEDGYPREYENDGGNDFGCDWFVVI